MHGNERLRVFIVDDDPSIANLASALLRHANMDASPFYDALSAAQQVLISKPHVVVTDFQMPLFNGLELTAWLHENSPACKVILLTGNAQTVMARTVPALKFTLLEKPINSQTLIAAVLHAVS